MSLDEPPSLSMLPARARLALRRLDTVAGVRVLGWIVAVLAVIAVIVLLARGGSSPKDPSTVGAAAQTSSTASTNAAATSSSVAGRGIPGFTEAALRVSGPSGARQLCVAVASTDAARRQGMMGRTDFGGYDGMIFTFPSDTAASFYMRATPLPLSIAWFDGTGAFVSSADMAPCPDRAGCPTFTATRPYRSALEVPRGGLAERGVSGGSVVALGGPCSPA